MNTKLFPLLFLSGAGGLISAAEKLDFNRDVRPVLSDNCFACHGFDAKKRKAGLRLDVPDSALRAIDGVFPIKPGAPEASSVMERILSTDEDDMMPPPETHKRLTAAQVDVLRRWIAEGAEYKKHWSFEPILKPRPPEVAANDPVRNPIDAFVQERLAADKLAPAPEADRETLIRRVTLDLTGLPPGAAAVRAFLADTSAGAYEKVVKRLLKSPRYGEHMARYWLDAARYADTHGMHLDNERSMWPYRDWVVRAFNANLPFDQFTIWQLAGDLLPEATEDQRMASGFNRCNVTSNEAGSIDAEYLFRYAVDRTDTTMSVWLGLTAGCAACHDHKFDPISQREFYSLYAFFNSAADPALDGNAPNTPPLLQLPTQDQRMGLAGFDLRLATVQARMDQVIANHRYTDPSADKSLPATRAAHATDPRWSWNVWKEQNQGVAVKGLPNDLRQFVRATKAADWPPEQSARLQQWWFENVYEGTRKLMAKHREEKSALAKARVALEQEIPATLIMADLPEQRPAFVMTRGQYNQPGEEVSRGTPAALPPMPPTATPTRLDLARWIVSPQHPLTARVAVNRIWQQFFGLGLVPTSGDFGSQGQPPTHPDLLDWLAASFRESGWDMKRLVTLIVTSRTYRQSSRLTGDSPQRDPDNRLLARGPRFRLDGEVLRDSALFVSGLLNPATGGRPVKPYQPVNIWEPVGFGSSNTRFYKQDHGDALYRRSLYTFWKRTAPPPSMTAFDAPNRESTCYRRERSNTPLQALNLMNDVQYVEAARHLATRVIRQSKDTPGRLNTLMRLVLARAPTEEESGLLTRTLASHLTAYTAAPDEASRVISTGESKPDSELPPAELAAWTLLASLILNLDEFITKG